MKEIFLKHGSSQPLQAEISKLVMRMERYFDLDERDFPEAWQLTTLRPGLEYIHLLGKQQDQFQKMKIPCCKFVPNEDTLVGKR